MLKRRTIKPQDRASFVRSCDVFVEREGEQAIVVHCFNHAGLTAEIPGTAQLCAGRDVDELGRVVTKALDGCIWQPNFDYSESKRSDWPAFQASRESSLAGFERRWVQVGVRGANDSNATWIVETRTGLDYSLSLTASVAPATDTARLGSAILYVIDKSTKLV